MAEKVVIIGSGPAGLTAAIYASRANLGPIVLEGVQAGGTAGGQLVTTDVIENFPGFPDGIKAFELVERVRAQALRFGTRLVSEDVIQIDLSQHPFSLVSSDGNRIEALTIILATGARARRLALSSEKKLWGRGVSACAVCDGGLPIFRNKVLAVIGGGDSALEEALHLTHFGSKILVVHRRDEFRASKIMQERVLKHPKIEVLWNKMIEGFLGEEVLSGLRLKDTVTGQVSSIEVSGAFEAIGHEPNTAFLEGQIKLNENGYIILKPGTSHTSTDGVFAAGDVHDPRYRQAITAAGAGCMAALDAERWLGERDFI